MRCSGCSRVTQGPGATPTPAPPVVCYNGGVSIGSFCSCPSTYTGLRCETPLDSEYISIVVINAATCIDYCHTRPPRRFMKLIPAMSLEQSHHRSMGMYTGCTNAVWHKGIQPKSGGKIFLSLKFICYLSLTSVAVNKITGYQF